MGSMALKTKLFIIPIFTPLPRDEVFILPFFGLFGRFNKITFLTNRSDSGLGRQCTHNGKMYNDGEMMQIANEYGKDAGDAFCRRCTCSGGQPRSCELSYYCDTEYLLACEKPSVAPGECCPTCGE